MEEVKAAVIKFVKDRDWDQFRFPANLAKTIAIESGELLECFQWNDAYDKKEVCKELADVVNCAILLADKLGVSLEDIVMKKLEENSRKYPVGKSKGNSKNTRNYNMLEKFFEIRNYSFDQRAINNLAAEDHLKENWPVVYQIYNNQQICIDETTNLKNRMNQHLVNVEKSNSRHGPVKVVFDEAFNKSVALDLEPYLIRYFNGDGKLVFGRKAYADPDVAKRSQRQATNDERTSEDDTLERVLGDLQNPHESRSERSLYLCARRTPPSLLGVNVLTHEGRLKND